MKKDNDAQAKLEATVLERLTKGKRFDAHITELFFEHTLKEKFSCDVAHGIIKVESRTKSGTYDFYYFIEESATPPNSLFRLHQSTKANVYLVSSLSDYTLDEKADIKVRLLLESGHVIEERLSEEFSQSINNWSQKNKHLVESQNARTLFKYLINLDRKACKKLVFGRLLLDVVFDKRYPIDLDTIDIYKGALQVYEYKRKTPAKNLIRIDNQRINSLKALYVTEKKAKYVLSKIDNATYQDTLRVFAEGMDCFPPISSECFSLDFSHIRNLFYCDKFAIQYLYLIWVQESDEITKLIDFDLTAKKDLNLLTSRHYLIPSHIEGITFTNINDSGDIADKTKQKKRAQCTFSKKQFRAIELNISSKK